MRHRSIAQPLVPLSTRPLVNWFPSFLFCSEFFLFSFRHRNFHHPVQLIFKNPVSLLNLIQREAVCDKRRGVYLAFFDQAK